jgi:hypothetical protein
VPLQLQQPEFPRDGFGLLPDGRVVTLMPQDGKGCSPVMIGTTGVQPRPLVPGSTAASVADTKGVTCNKPVVTVATGRPVFSDGTRLFAMN